MDPNADRGNQLVYTAVIFLTLSWVAVMLRCFVRIHLLKAFKIDDWLLVIGELNFILTLAMVLAGVKYGLGKHNIAVPVEPRIEAMKYQAIATITYTVVMAFIKLSIGFFLLRFTIDRRYVFIINLFMVIVAIWTIGIFFVNLLQCKPIKFQWDFRIKGTCISPKSYIIVTWIWSILSIITDWFYALIPIPMIWPILTQRRTKLLVALPLSFGVFASVATIIRIKFLSGVLDYSDILYAPTDTMIWTIVEPGVAIIAASMATMKPLVEGLITGRFYTTTTTSSSGDGVFNTPRSSNPPKSSDPTLHRRHSLAANLELLETPGVARDNIGSGISTEHSRPLMMPAPVHLFIDSSHRKRIEGARLDTEWEWELGASERDYIFDLAYGFSGGRGGIGTGEDSGLEPSRSSSSGPGPFFHRRA